MIRIVAIILALMACCCTAQAERRVALVFGEDAYRTVRPLGNAVADAQTIASTLEKLGFAVSLETNRDLRRMRRALDDFRTDAAGADVALVYYAGHGVEIGGDNRLLPVDTDVASIDALENSTLPLNEVRDTVAATGKIGLILLDACRTDPFGTVAQGGRSAVALTSAVAAQAKPGLGRLGRSENILFAFSAAPGETASDGADGHSPFAQALVKYLPTDGLEIRSVLTLVQQEVYDFSHGRQLPYVESGLPKIFFAATGIDQLPERERLLLAMADVTPSMRDEVEKVASRNAMPLAPLYGALISADLKATSADERSKKLAQAAAAYVETQGKLKTLASTDSDVTRLRQAAEASLALGAFADARESLAKAAAIDAGSGETLSRNLVARRLSEAGTHAADAGIAEAQLDYRAAIAALRQAAALHAKVADEQITDADRCTRDSLLADLGDLEIIVGDTSAALSAYSQMADAATKRATASPGESDAQRDLATSRTKIGDVAVAQGDLNGALVAYRSALAVSDGLAASQPQSAALARDRLGSNAKIGQVLAAKGDYSGALAAYQARSAILDQLVRSDPDNAVNQRDLYVSDLTIGDLKRAKSDVAGALASYRAGVDIARRLDDADPNSLQRHRDLAAGMERTGDMKAALGDLTGALADYQENLGIHQLLTDASPDNAGWRMDLSIAYEKIGDLKKARTDLDGALAAFQASFAVRDRLARSDPHNADWQRAVGVTHSRLGDISVARGDPAGAISAYQASVAISAALNAADPSNSIWLSDLASYHDKIANLKLSQGDSSGALAAFETNLPVSRRLAASAPGNSAWQRGLMLTLGSVATLKQKKRDFQGAIEALRDEAVVASRIARASPDNPKAQVDLAGVNETLGDVESAAGDWPGALTAYKNSNSIYGRLAQANPKNADRQRDLARSYVKLSGAGADPRGNLLEALQVVNDMETNGILGSGDARMRPELERRLKALGSSVR